MTEWIIICNPNSYDVMGAFRKLKRIDWKQSINAEIGDQVFIYVGKPEKAIRYKCIVRKTNLPTQEIDDNDFRIDDSNYDGFGRYMELELVKQYNNEKLNLDALMRNGLKTVQGPSRATPQLSSYLKESLERDDTELQNSPVGMKIYFENITERDMDLFLMRKLSDISFLKDIFLNKINCINNEVSILNITHSVSTEDGESDIEVLLVDEKNKKIALLIEDKINAPAMEDQARRYIIRGDKGKERGDYEEYYVFIVAPQKYLDGNTEAGKYPNKISYESIKKWLESSDSKNPFEISLINRALDVSKHGYVTLYNKTVTDFWDRLYDYVEKHYPGQFRIHGKKGLEKSGNPAQWITITCNNQFGIQIKSDRGYVDLEIRNYADKFQQFCKDNQQLIDEKKLYIRTASKALAIRYYVECIDFTQEFETQEAALRMSFDAAKELQDLIKVLKVR